MLNLFESGKPPEAHVCIPTFPPSPADMRNSYKMLQRQQQQRLRSIHTLFQLGRVPTERPEVNFIPEQAPLMMEDLDYERLEGFSLPESRRSAYGFVLQVLGISPQQTIANFFQRLTGETGFGRYASHLRLPAPQLLQLFLCALTCGWRVASRWFLLARAMAFARLYDIAKQYGLVQTNVPSLTSAPFARRRSIALFGPVSRPASVAEPPSSGFIWSTAVPHILNLTQRIQSLETSLELANGEKVGLETRLTEATRTIEDLTVQLRELERKRAQDSERVDADILSMQLRADFLQLEGENLRQTNDNISKQMSEFKDAIAGRDSTINKLLIDVASLVRDNELLSMNLCALETQLVNAQRIITEKDAKLFELQTTMPDPQMLGVELARLQNQQLDSCVFKKEDDSEDSIIIVTSMTEPDTSKKDLKPLTSDMTPSPSATLEIPVFTSPRPSLPPKKANNLKPLLLAARFTTSASSRRLLGRKRSAVSLRASENKAPPKVLNPQAPEFKPRFAPDATKDKVEITKAEAPMTPLLVRKRLPTVDVLMTPRTTRAASMRLIRSRVVSRTSKMNSSRSKEGLTLNMKGGLTAISSRPALGELTNLN